ncbi:hypothetical protein GGF31_005019 [Allomyces arbusculus]|nr:hypothetical protein GGF31_005019 [Allomyces arbusculus]
MPPSMPQPRPPAAARAAKLYFDPGSAKVRTRYGWAGKFMPGHCFLCTACLSGPTLEYPCPRTAQGHTCPGAKMPVHKGRSRNADVGRLV